MKRPELMIKGPGYDDVCFPVGDNGARLGRSSSNDIPIRDEELSRNHCLFEVFGESGIRITDLASANGTFVNDVRLAEDAVDLKVGDKIKLGKSVITVVSAERRNKPKAKSVDLGLGTVKGDAIDEPEKSAVASRNSRRTILWAIAVFVVAGAISLVLISTNGSKSQAVHYDEISEAPVDEALREFSYEKVAADSEHIYRCAVEFTEDGTLKATIDDLSGDGRHVNRSAPLPPTARKRLLEILQDDGFLALDREFSGPEEDPPKLNSWNIRFRTESTRKNVLVLNTQEPTAFRRVRENLEAFTMNELGIRALQYSRDRLIEMSVEAASVGRTKWEDRDVEYGNLHASICAYREAIADLETVNPKPPEFDGYRAAMEASEKELAKRYDNQRFIADQACSVKDWEAAVKSFRIICEMIPDRNDARNHEAATKLIDAEGRIKKGGR